jgi:prepilin-type N-terminal cleavage/methylation domain-containing protein
MKNEIKRQGYTLIEVLIAMTIFTLGFLALATLQIKSITQNARAKMLTDTTTMAVESLERLISLPYNHTDLSQQNSPHSINTGPYTIQWSVQDDMPVTAAKTIVLQVTGANPYAKPITISYVKGQSFYGRVEASSPAPAAPTQ